MNKVMDTTTTTGTVLGKMTDQVVASDLLTAAKTSVKTYASALTETATPAVRSVLKKQLDEAITFQDQVASYVIKKGWYNVYDMNAQVKCAVSDSEKTISELTNY